MCTAQFGFNEVLISSSISQLATSDVVAEQAALPPLPHKEQGARGMELKDVAERAG